MARTKKAVEAAPEVAAASDIDIRDTALSGIEGTLVAVNAVQGLNLRGGPSLMYDVLEVLPEGAVLVKLELPYGASVQGWALVHTGQYIGWAAERYLRTLEG